MAAFILKFAMPTEAIDKLTAPPMHYDTASEIMVFMEKNEPAIEHLNAIMATGSLLTRADGDPTMDESTDRQ
jgi:hypothetical protein